MNEITTSGDLALKTVERKKKEKEAFEKSTLVYFTDERGFQRKGIIKAFLSDNQEYATIKTDDMEYTVKTAVLNLQSDTATITEAKQTPTSTGFRLVHYKDDLAFIRAIRRFKYVKEGDHIYAMSEPLVGGSTTFVATYSINWRTAIVDKSFKLDGDDEEDEYRDALRQSNYEHGRDFSYPHNCRCRKS